MSDTETPGPTQNLVDPNVPADQGLSTLGLLMQLSGTLLAAYASLLLFIFMLLPSGMGGEKGMMLLVLATCIGRSAVHRMAGTELLYGKRTGLTGVDGGSPLAGVKRYVLVALIQSAIVAVILKFKMEASTSAAIGIFAGLAAWPALLGALFALPRFKRFHTEIPVSEDKGFEGVAIVMTVLGLCGALGTGAFLILMMDNGSRILSQGPGVLLLVALVMLFIRSIFHIQAGFSGLRETSLDKSVERANRYANFGVISSFCAAGAILIVSMMGAVNIFVVAFVAGICWLLMAWPLIIRRFFSERQFADLMAGDETVVHRRAPDAGLTGLGWLLLGHAVLGASMLVPQLIAGRDMMDDGAMKMMSLMGPMATKSLWWNAGMLAFQAWAGYELIRMSAPSRIIASAYALVVGGLTIWLTYPVLKSLGNMGRHFAPETVTLFIPMAINLVIPVATLLLVNRKIAPVAKARFVSKPST